jgi:hypothetical protein
MSRVNAIVVIGLTSGMLAGCGAATARSPRSAVHQASAPTPAYIARGEAICATELAGLERTPHPTTPEQSIGYLPPALAVMRRETVALQTLDPPAPERAKLDAALASTHALATLLARFLHELRTGTVAFAELADVQRQSMELQAQVDARFRQAGLARCAA